MKKQAGDEIFFGSTVNFRELGGYKSFDGRQIKYGQFYRSGMLFEIQGEEDIYKLNSFGIKVILDLRSQKEAEEYPDLEIPRAEYYNICALLEEDGSEMAFSPNDIAEILNSKDGMMAGVKQTLRKMYGSMPFGNRAFQKLFQELELNHVPILFHCTSGKDRTGVAAMLILLALGVDEKDVLDDYELTNLYRKKQIEETIRRHEDEIRENSELVKVFTITEGVSRESGELVFRLIKEKYGTYEKYFEAEFGLTKERLNRLRDLYLENDIC